MSTADELTVQPVDEQAADWFARRRGERFSAADERQFQIWLQASRSHAQAYADLELLWHDMDSMTPPTQTCAEDTSASNVVRLPRRWSRRLSAIAASVVLIAGLLAISPLVERPEYQLTAQAEMGKLRKLLLADGSQITLNMGSSAQVRYFDNRREVSLQGEAFFSVVRDEKRPFVVQADRAEVQVLGTRFNVRQGEDTLDVAVEHGKVAVDAGAPRLPAVLLSVGEAVHADYRLDQQQMRPVAVDAVASWRSGQLVFQQRPLAHLLDELSRYLGKPVRLNAEALADYPLSGSLDIYRPQDFLASLPLLLPVQVSSAADGSVTVETR
ncbi:transmembrane sensor [Halopseudomonas sabulinigri]|uniref:Transmembrane sensor n=1 Tax=Halopseudomonas sabulinigri TaxID=472181 RepID=A0A1H1XE06_9GAMM|nr:FecR domain-containing protein [Halopseudomonas sabulinigri]SDT07494.1 transmembrane sensor [Halopseudomonas sabulinigri]